MNGDPVPLVLTKADPEPGWEPPPDAVIRIQMRLSRMPIESSAQFADEVLRVQAQDAERLAEVLADTLPEGTVQRLVGFLLVRTAGVRMGLAPLGDPRNADRGIGWDGGVVRQWIAELERAQDVSDVEYVCQKMRGRLGLPAADAARWPGDRLAAVDVPPPPAASRDPRTVRGTGGGNE